MSLDTRILLCCAVVACRDSHGPPDTSPGFFQDAIAATGDGFQCALRPDGRAYCWGNNTSGATGTGLEEEVVAKPTPVAGALVFDTLVAGWDHVCGLAPNGDAYCWGGTTDGGDIVRTPQHVGPGIWFTTISASVSTACGIAQDARAYCWNSRSDGSGPSRQPKPILAASDLVALSTSSGGTCALKREGSVVCWGPEVSLFLPGVPLQTGPDTAVSAPAGATFHRVLAVGGLGVCGYDAEDQLYCLGMNAYGELGDGTREVRSAWTLIPQPPGRFRSHSTSHYRSAALDRTGRLLIWGKPSWVDEAWKATPWPVVPRVRWASFDLEFTSYCGVTTQGQFGCLENWQMDGSPSVTFYSATPD